ncbi:hypothetical protein SRB5_21890 [Streptomyces sp. RB5]|uniref:PepSY domain-containing protein n=1 Tax=Streptomyces smaragdinus TaxID=2585196 RepID=A0A7K0CF14_9ACTN|nr:PepSY domain-containing protein [Streptomyces smaragdinus]MQY12060.1 hypothetical protein [Streptomyces smaragdinus]
MNRNILLAAVTAAVLTAGTVTAVAVTGDGSPGPQRQRAAAPVRGDSPRTDVRDDRARDDRGRDDGRRRDDRRSASPSPRSSRTGAPQAPVTADEAARAALRLVPGRITSLEFEGEGARQWEIEVAGRDGKSHRVTVDARGTAVPAPDRHGHH